MNITLLISAVLLSTSAMAAEKIYLDRLKNTLICHHCNLSDAQLQGQDFSGADMSEALLKGINLSDTKLVGCWFTRSRVQNANFENADLSTALMDYANFTGVNFKGAKLDGAKLNFANLTNANLKGASLKNTTIRGVLFCNTTMPDGEINNSGCKK